MTSQRHLCYREATVHWRAPGRPHASGIQMLCRRGNGVHRESRRKLRKHKAWLPRAAFVLVELGVVLLSRHACSQPCQCVQTPLPFAAAGLDVICSPLRCPCETSRRCCRRKSARSAAASAVESDGSSFGAQASHYDGSRQGVSPGRRCARQYVVRGILLYVRVHLSPGACGLRVAPGPAAAGDSAVFPEPLDTIQQPGRTRSRLRTLQHCSL